MQEHKHAGYVPPCVKYKLIEEANRAVRAFVPAPVSGREFDIRDQLVKQIGFANYAAYLKSDLWVVIRSRVFNRSNGNCVKCGKTAIAIHHCEYTLDNLLGKGSLSKLWAVCAECHRFLHRRGCNTWQSEKRQAGETQGPR